MKFHIDSDDTATISLWIAPENPSETPVIQVIVDETRTYDIRANVVREDIKNLGLHHTGHTGFYISSKSVPRIKTAKILRIVEKNSGLTIYNRSTSEHTPNKVLIFDFLYEKPIILAEVLGPFFELQYRNIETINYETIDALLQNKSAHSMLAYGTPDWAQIQETCDKNAFYKGILLIDPIEALCRSIFQLASGDDLSQKKSNVSEFFQRLQKKIQSTNLENKADIISLFRGLSIEERSHFRSPIVRAITTPTAGDVRSQDVITALNSISNFDFISTPSTLPILEQQLQYLLGIETVKFPHIQERSEKQLNLYHILNSISVVKDLIFEDMLLFDAVNTVLNRSIISLSEKY